MWGEGGLIRESAGCSRRRAGFTACREIKLPKIRRVQKFGSGTLVWRENSTRHCCNGWTMDTFLMDTELKNWSPAAPAWGAGHLLDQ